MRNSRLATLKSNSWYLFIGSILAWIAVSHLARADGDAKPLDWLGPSFSIRPSYWSKDTSFSGQTNYLVGSAWLTLRPMEVAGFKAFFDGYVVGQNYTRSSNTTAEARELYVEKTLGTFDFKVGRQITVWGRADKINPTDNLSVTDSTLLMTEPEDQRKGVFATQVVYNWGQTQFIGIWQPEWRSPTYPVPSSLGFGFQDVTPNHSQNNFGFKIDQSGGFLDGSLSYFNGFSKTPDLSLLSGTTIGFNHNPIQVIGGDFAKAVGDYSIRGEAAYTFTQDSNGTNPFIANPNFFAVLGLERSFSDQFNLNAQVMYLNVINFQDPSAVTDPNARQLAQEESVITNQKYAQQFGATLRPDFKAFNETLEIEVALAAWFGNGDLLIRPRITYAFTDHIKGVVGGAIYLGPSDTYFGQLNPVSSAFAEFRYNF